MSTEGPTIIRPIPRRPFNYENNEKSATSSPRSARGQSSFNPASAVDNSNSLSRAASMTNLTSSTLSGIYASTEDPETPWGIGAQTPIRRVTIQEEQELSAIELNKEHSSMLRRRLSTTLSPPRDLQRPKQRNLSTLIPRAVLLFALGMGYGLLVTTLSDGRRHHMPEADGLMHPGSDWRYLVFWGAIGVVLGGLLPWFDSIYDDVFSSASKAKAEIDPVVAIQMLNLEQDRKEEKPSTDWALVIRGVGAFVGIAFAIRRLSWTSSLQASATLALANPFLWYLIDRSKPGFLLSSAVGLTGSAMLLGLNPRIMPPAGPIGIDARHANRSHVGEAYAGDPMTLGGLASRETVESGIWMLSVLFCSCVCFGNIGRRLAWQRGAKARGRWGGLR